MKTYRKILILFFRQLRTSFTRKRVTAGYLVGIISSLMAGVNYYRFLGNHTANFAEAFIQHLSTIGDVTVLMLGFVLAVSDAPFIQTDSFMMIHRSGRKHWYDAMWLYVIAQALLYYGCSFLMSVLCTIPKCYYQNIWSRALKNYANASTSRYQINIPSDDMLARYSPYTALLHTFLLIVLYSVLLAGILYALNLYVSTAIGTIVVAAVHLIGMIIKSVGIFLSGLLPWAFIINAVFQLQFQVDLSLAHSYLYFLVCIWAVYLIGRIGVAHADFQLLERGGDDA